MSRPDLIFFGDDFTGSTDALEVVGNKETGLYMQLPERVEDKVIGLAGQTRAMNPEAMKATLEPVFRWIKSQEPKFIHYKVCSTFDSSEGTGNLVTVIHLARQVFGRNPVPVLAAAPALGRFTAFGHHFASFGTGSNADVYALNVHPSMSVHPTTPATESDLRKHLSKQGQVKTGLIDLRTVQRGADAIIERFKALKEFDAVLFDATNEEDICSIGQALQKLDQPCFIIGSSAVEQAVLPKVEETWTLEPLTRPILVLSGSCSPVTGEQIEYALQHGFGESSHMDLSGADAVLAEGRSLIIHANGTRERSVGGMLPQELGESLASAALKLLAQHSIGRIVVAGGDTSGFVTRGLEIDKLNLIYPLIKGAPVCRISSANSLVDQKQIILKGGQVGDSRFFLTAAQ